MEWVAVLLTTSLDGGLITVIAGKQIVYVKTSFTYHFFCFFIYFFYFSNLNGLYTAEDGSSTPRIAWIDWHMNQLKFTQMMIKPKSYSFINTH